MIDCPQRTAGTESVCREGGYNRQLLLSLSGALHSHSWITCALFAFVPHDKLTMAKDF